jgi:acetylglutamate kinase
MIQVIKIGGNILNDQGALGEFLEIFSANSHDKILIHGGGKEATSLAGELNIETKMIDGRRITDEPMLKVVTMVYGGLINKNLVAKLQALGCNAIGMSGADMNIIPAHKRNHPDIDFGYVGDFKLEDINSDGLLALINMGITPVICALTHDGKGSLLNTNADTMAAGIASALGKVSDSELHLCFEKRGVLEDAEDDSSVIPEMSKIQFDKLKAEGAIHSGMIPKLDNGFQALSEGVKKVIVRHALYPGGTVLINE